MAQRARQESEDVDRLERAAVRAVLKDFQIDQAHRASEGDPDEEVILLSEEDSARVERSVLTRRLREVLPERRVWVTTITPRWRSEAI
jgi:hypothetical protein